MKKAYVKPELYFEDFELSENMATGCGMITKQLGKDACGFDDGVTTIFISTNTGCKYTAEDGYGSICYHVPTDAGMLFTS